jgi:hypothetical protein
MLEDGGGHVPVDGMAGAQIRHPATIAARIAPSTKGRTAMRAILNEF